MAKNEETSSKIATLAAKVLSGQIKHPTPAQLKSLAASALTQTPDKKKGK